jgi:hypothetical protein
VLGDLICLVGVQLLKAAFVDFKISCSKLPPFQFKKFAINDMKFSFAEPRAVEMCGKKCTG